MKRRGRSCWSEGPGGLPDGRFEGVVWFMPDSDVDLAVEGLESADYWEAWRLAEEMIGDRSVDLIELETAGDSLRRAIERYGVDL